MGDLGYDQTSGGRPLGYGQTGPDTPNVGGQSSESIVNRRPREEVPKPKSSETKPHLSYQKPQEGTYEVTKADAKAPVGEGGRFAALKQKLGGQKGVTNPGGLAAYIGRMKYGKSKFQQMSEKGKS